MAMPHILVLGGIPRILQKAAASGLRITNYEKPGVFDPDIMEYCERVHLFDYQDIGLVTELTRTLHTHDPFSRIITQSEIGQVIAGHLNTVLGLPGNGAEVTATLHDKMALRELLNAKGIGPVPAARRTTREELRAFAAAHGGAVVKPVMGSGSLGVRTVRSPGEVDEVWEWIETYGHGDFMVEELLEGEEISVETFTLDGRHTVLAITGKETDGGVIERGHVIPAALPAPDAEAVAAFTREVLDAVGLVDGVAHTEIMLTESGPRVVESHSRCGGDRISKLVELATGVDLEDLPFQREARGDFTVPPPEPRGAAAIRFLRVAPGRVTEVSGVDAVRAARGVAELKVYLEVGDTVRPEQWSDDRRGYVLVHAATREEAVRRSRELAESIVIRTEPVGTEDVSAVPMRDVLAQAHEVLDPFA
ncbi:ATP-grasp domain-containing protein [Streptomyces sp. NA02950]|uniref:ATP-grasp domain-containing protein n=1 Tax=Streptomyces sp. NA02950 TaxID=2742137 RepID=UPI0015918E69|nr:ATP-grasp domain-containing protein [Streptomyces sp. NA02950]QKV91463.1 ATP-grasp domain-containing protein [Streptomyces sp. NA02950]